MSRNEIGCGAEAVPRHRPGVRLTTEGAEQGPGHAFMSGIVTCGRVWSCAVCSNRICRHRGEEIQQAIDNWRAEGGAVWLVTATIPHNAGHRLAEALGAITKAWTFLKAGEPWKRQAARIGYVGAIKGSEATHGAAGWHPHIHALFFLESDPGLEVEAEFLEWMTARWARKVESFYVDPATRKLRCWPMNYRGGVEQGRPEGIVSLFGRPHPEVGIRITKADKAGAYVAKMGLGKEVSQMDVKAGRNGNRTPWQILCDHMELKRTADAWLWREWYRTTRGRRHLVWSRGLRERVAPSQLELTDDEIAAATPPESELVVEFEPYSWHGLQRASVEGAGEDFGSLACRIIEKTHDPGVLAVIAQSLLRSAGIPGEVRFDPGRRFMWIA